MLSYGVLRHADSEKCFSQHFGIVLPGRDKVTTAAGRVDIVEPQSTQLHAQTLIEPHGGKLGRATGQIIQNRMMI